MSKKNEEVRNQEPKKGFVARYEEMRHSAWKVAGMFLYTIIAIPSFIAVSFYINWLLIGDGFYNYSEKAYDDIKTVVETNVVQDMGINTTEIKNVVDKYVLSYEDGETTLKCTIQQGYFEATVTTKISATFELYDSERNYNSEAEYMGHFLPIFAARTIGGGLVAWLLITALAVGLMQFIILLIKCFTDKTNSEEKPGNVNVENLETT